MRRIPQQLLLAFCVAAPLAVTYQAARDSAGAQEAGTDPRMKLNDGIPPAALLTDRGRELADSLKNLRRTRANLGPKHPTLPVIEQAISDTEKQLQAWLPNGTENENPFKTRDAAPRESSLDVGRNSSPAGMNSTDLRQLVLRLHERVEALEARVQALERLRN